MMNVWWRMNDYLINRYDLFSLSSCSSLSIIFVRFNPCWGSWDEKQTKLKVGIRVTWLCRWAENWLKLSCQTRQYQTFPGFWVSKKKDSHIAWKRPKKSHFTMLTYNKNHLLVLFWPFLARKSKVFYPLCKMWNSIISFIWNSILLFPWSVSLEPPLRHHKVEQVWSWPRSWFL